MSTPGSASSRRQLLSAGKVSPAEQPQISFQDGAIFRDPKVASPEDIRFQKVLNDDAQTSEETLLQVEIRNDELFRKATRSQLASRSLCLTQRWQTILFISISLLLLAAGIGGLAYWISLPKVITQPYLLWGESCYANSRSCDASRMLWCPAGTCLCTGNFQWNATAQNCSCGTYQQWTGVKCLSYGSYGDICDSILCKPSLNCSYLANQTYNIPNKLCLCDDLTYLDTSTGNCVDRLTYNQACQTKFDCKNWLGLSCTNTSAGLFCRCSSNSYWNGSICVQNAQGWEPCSVTIPCDTTKSLTCVSGLCQCDSLSFWNNVTTFTCEQRRTYASACQFSFQCNQTVGLSCPSSSTGCTCPTASSANICDCAAGQFWDGQRCIARHSFNGTCPFQNACSANLVCWLGHCICPGNMVWNSGTSNCVCPGSTAWNSVLNTCI